MVRAPALEVRIAQRITADGSVIIPPRVARWLENQAGMTADRRSRLRDSDPEAYVALAALHLSALCSESGTNHAVPPAIRADLTSWMTTSEAAQTLNVTDRCIRTWCKSGRLYAVRSGSRWLIDRNTVALQRRTAHEQPHRLAG